MANYNAKGKTAAHGSELAQRTRKAVLNTFDAIEKSGKRISDILAAEFEKNPIKFMELASKLIPKEINGNFNHSHSEIESLSNDELKKRIAEAQQLVDSIRGDIEATDNGASEKSGDRAIH